MKINALFLAAAAGTALAAPHCKAKYPGHGESRILTVQVFGCSESGLEFGSDIPGTYGTTYTNPLNSSIKTLNSDGFNTFRIPFLMERLTTEITGSFNEDYLELLTEAVDYVTGLGAYAVLDPHNYGRFNSEIISSTDNFKTWWTNVATVFADNDLVIFDTNNEYHDMDESLVVSLNQAAINGIRAAGATTQYIFVEGNSYTGAWTWTEQNTDMASLTDSEDKIIYEMHQYLDSDGSGTSETCVSSSIGKERVEKATTWLKNNNKVGVIGEFAGGNNDVCKEAISGMLSYLSDNSDVWMGALWWSAGPWWGDYMYSMEPSDGAAYTGFMSTLKPYFP
ncbi:endo-a-1,4-glucanase [Aspergillus venezuelensis]